MLTAHTANGKAFWIDLLDPTSDEITQVAAEYGIEVPSRESLQEIETSSRLRAEGQVLYLSMPLTLQDETADFAPIPLGFILSPAVLVTVRYSVVQAFAQIEEDVAKGLCADGATVFAALIESIVDINADRLEKLSSDLAVVSAQAFGPQGDSAKAKKRASRALRESLNAVGTAGDHLSRIIGYVLKMTVDWLLQEKTRLSTAQQDVASLVDFEAHLSGKTQFLLDAILGFINTEQNDIFKVLTIVSVVGIPPTLIASMYGMNFHNMPELSWRWGYPYGLVLIALSILVPILWFKRRGWW